MTAPVHPGGERPGTFAERHVSILRSALLDYQADWHANIANDPEGSAVQIESAQELLDALPVAERSNAVPDLMDMLRWCVMADYSRWMCFRSLCTPGAPCNELTCGWEDVPPAVAAMIDLARVATPHPATPQAPTVDSVPDRLPDGVYRSEDTFWMVRHWWDDLPAGWIRRGDANPAHEVFAVMPAAAGVSSDR